MILRTFYCPRLRGWPALMLFPLVLLAGCASPTRVNDLQAGSDRPLGSLGNATAGVPDGAGNSWIIASERYPLSPEQRATTDPTIYLRNLDSRIDVLSRRAAEHDDASAAASLALALLQRAQLIGRSDAVGEAHRWAEQAVAWAPGLPLAWRALAASLAAVHQFDQATAALDKAAQLGVAESELAPMRRDIAVGLGRYDELRAELGQADRPVADFHALAHRADLLMLQGDLRGASLWYRSAQDFYHDDDPLPLAWLYVQQGIALLRFEQVEEARRFFQAAYDRLPMYYLAAEHLAECEALLGNLDRAREIYLQVIEQTGSPEFMAALAELENIAGRAADAERWQSAAARGFERRAADNEAAFAQHAAEFWLSIGKAEQAVDLARHNLLRRNDMASLLLGAKAEQAVGNWKRTCALIRQIEQTGLQPPELAQIDQARRRCKDQ